MTLTEAKRTSDLLRMMEDAIDFAASFAEPSTKNREFILFENVVAADNIDGDGERGGWEGPLRVPRDIAVEMMLWLQSRAETEMASYGVNTTADKESK